MIVDGLFSQNKDDAIGLAVGISKLHLYELQYSQKQADKDLYQFCIQLKKYFAEWALFIDPSWESVESDSKSAEEFYKVFVSFSDKKGKNCQIL